MNYQLKRIKIGARNPRNGQKPTSAELYADNKLIAAMFDEARGGVLKVDIIDKDEFKNFENFVTSQPSTYDSYKNMDVDEWFAIECDEFESNKVLSRKAKDSIIFYNKKTGHSVTAKCTNTIAAMLTNPDALEKLRQRVQQLNAEYGPKGFELFNPELKSLL